LDETSSEVKFNLNQLERRAMRLIGLFTNEVKIISEFSSDERSFVIFNFEKLV
jgi:hypothetical protein